MGKTGPLFTWYQIDTLFCIIPHHYYLLLGCFFKGITSSKSDCAVTDRGQINCQLLIRACGPGHGYNENKVCSVWFYKPFERTRFFLCFTNFVGYCIALDNYKGIINNNKDVLSKLQHVLLCCVLGLSWIGFSMLF